MTAWLESRIFVRNWLNNMRQLYWVDIHHYITHAYCMQKNEDYFREDKGVMAFARQAEFQLQKEVLWIDIRG